MEINESNFRNNKVFVPLAIITMSFLMLSCENETSNSKSIVKIDSAYDLSKYNCDDTLTYEITGKATKKVYYSETLIPLEDLKNGSVTLSSIEISKVLYNVGPDNLLVALSPSESSEIKDGDILNAVGSTAIIGGNCVISPDYLIKNF